MRDSDCRVYGERRAAGWDAPLPLLFGPRMTPWVPVALSLGDAIAVVAAYAAALSIWSGRTLPVAFAQLPGLDVVSIVGVWLTVLWLLHLYERRIDLSVVSRWPALVIAASLSTMFVLSIGVLGGFSALDGQPLGYEVVVIAWAISLVSLFVARTIVRAAHKFVRRRGVFEKRTLILGAGEVGTMIACKMLRSPELGLLPVAFWDAEPPDLPVRDELDLPVYRREGDLDRIIVSERINHVLVAFSTLSFHEIVSNIERCCDHPVEVTVVPRFFEITAAQTRMDEIEGIPIARIRRRGMTRIGAATKRVLDIVTTLGGLAVVAPIMIAAAIAIGIESGSPVLFRQERIGKNGKPFRMLKFRSMVHTAERDKVGLIDMNESTGPLFKMRADPRVTKVGRWIRRYSIDELPQLFNVLKGDMSLVGPRPPLPEEVERYSEWHRKRLSVTPGITGLWQILGRTELSFDEMVSLDLNYIWNWTLWLDLSILARTFGVVVHGRGAC